MPEGEVLGRSGEAVADEAVFISWKNSWRRLSQDTTKGLKEVPTEELSALKISWRYLPSTRSPIPHLPSPFSCPLNPGSVRMSKE